MKKVLALALVLVLALGMMVPATAATKAKVIDILLTDDVIRNSEDLEPGDKVEIPFRLDYFDLNDEAKDAIDNASASSRKAVIEKIIKTMEPRFRVRSGGQIFKSIEIDNIKGPGAELNGTEIMKAVKKAANKLFEAFKKNGNYAGLNDAQKVIIDEAMAEINALTWTDIKLAASTTQSLRKTELATLLNSILANADTNAVLKTLVAAIKADAAKAFDATYIDEDAKLYGNWTFDVVLKTVDPFVSVKSVDYEVDIYFLIDGARTDDDYIYTLIGEFGNFVTEVDNDDYDVDSYQGQVIDATEYVSSIAIVGNYEYDITANVKMAKDKLIYFYVVTESDMSDEGIFDRYPSIEVAFRVHQVGLNSYTGNFIKMGGVDSAYYVYGQNADGTLKLLGRGGELLPLSAKYYISTVRLDLSDDEPVDEIPTDVPSIVDDYNPSTGI